MMKRILIVDDEVSLGASLVRYLVGRGRSVCSVEPLVISPSP
jgi:hypothetical protein